MLDSAMQAPSRPLGRPPKQSDQRQRIVNSAAKAIATVGYQQCSLADIAAELDLTRPALYHYFATKQQIFTEIAITAVKGMYQAADDVLDPQLSSTAQLRALMIANGDYFERNYWIVNATIAGYGGITRRELLRIDEIEDYRARYEKLIHRVLRNGIKCGEFRTINVAATTRSIFQLLNITRWYRPGGKKTAVDFAAENFELVIGGVITRNA